MYLLFSGEAFSGKVFFFFFSGKISNPQWERSSCIESECDTNSVYSSLQQKPR